MSTQAESEAVLPGVFEPGQVVEINGRLCRVVRSNTFYDTGSEESSESQVSFVPLEVADLGTAAGIVSCGGYETAPTEVNITESFTPDSSSPSGGVLEDILPPPPTGNQLVHSDLQVAGVTFTVPRSLSDIVGRFQRELHLMLDQFRIGERRVLTLIDGASGQAVAMASRAEIQTLRFLVEATRPDPSRYHVEMRNGRWDRSSAADPVRLCWDVEIDYERVGHSVGRIFLTHDGSVQHVLDVDLQRVAAAQRRHREESRRSMTIGRPADPPFGDSPVTLAILNRQFEQDVLSGGEYVAQLPAAMSSPAWADNTLEELQRASSILRHIGRTRVGHDVRHRSALMAIRFEVRQREDLIARGINPTPAAMREDNRLHEMQQRMAAIASERVVGDVNQAVARAMTQAAAETFTFSSSPERPATTVSTRESLLEAIRAARESTLPGALTRNTLCVNQSTMDDILRWSQDEAIGDHASFSLEGATVFVDPRVPDGQAWNALPPAEPDLRTIRMPPGAQRSPAEYTGNSEELYELTVSATGPEPNRNGDSFAPTPGNFGSDLEYEEERIQAEGVRRALTMALQMFAEEAGLTIARGPMSREEQTWGLSLDGRSVCQIVLQAGQVATRPVPPQVSPRRDIPRVALGERSLEI